MKTLVLTLCLAIGLCSCHSSANKVSAAHKDTVIANDPPPPTLSPAEIKKYHDIVSDFVDRNLSARYFNGGILVAKNGVIVYERYTGFANLKKKDSIE